MLPLRTRAPGLPGRDREAQVHPGAAGRPTVDHLDRVPRVAVVGGGIAGVTAAVALAERGVLVEVFEREPELGGRVTGWHTTHADGTGATMSRGFHAFFRQYYNLRALLRRIDPDLAMFTPVADYPLAHHDGTTETFAGLPLTPPWNVASFVLRSDTFTLRDLTRMNPTAAAGLFDVSVPGVYDRLDTVDAGTYLTDIGFPDAARHLAFEVFSRSFFAHPESLSAAELATMFHIYFLGSNEGLLFDVPTSPYPRAIWRPLHAHLTDLGARVRTGVEVDRITRGRDRPHRVGDHEFDAVVLAADTAGLRDVVSRSEHLGDPGWRGSVSRLRTAPPFLVSRYWLDRPVDTDRAAFLGTSGYRYLDNISVLDRFEDEARQWNRQTGGSVVELHAYALAEPIDTRQTAEAAYAEACLLYPELRRARPSHTEHVLRADCPLFAPGTFTDRPTVSTPDPTVVLAGDLVRVELPVALMERAATTGFLAANTLLARWSVRGHDVWTVPNGGRSPLLRRAARRAAARQKRHNGTQAPSEPLPR
ncbi:FAD-dependent oxidoreductase [Actinokineospora sp. NBRC 105648]|uniref:FAD-dependent oxidoreductase n=1 Tax=Actinokineospora sp. NBRC 105648 TaxID=3032206 RepID=UPI0024A226DE|nr:FAD-dependent oxidoreductase [Actinokineospora sp. NBRC 105648]GLZ40543.1 isorenieratene synthase [Actinokineospora sp. NBRC 105648]